MPIFPGGYTEKTALVNDDKFLTTESASAEEIKYSKWSTIKSYLLNVANNLSDLASAATARTNLDVYSKSEIASVTGAGIPTSAPDFIGQRYIDTTNGWRYTATGTSAVADWHIEYAYGTLTITSGGGDETINLGGNWINGELFVLFSGSTSDYISTASPAGITFHTTYDALTNTSYTAGQLLELVARPSTTTADQNNIAIQPKTLNANGAPKSATATTFTLDSDGVNTSYIKWIIKA